MTSPSGRMRLVAKVGVGLPWHQRMLRIPRGALRAAALGVWTAATCYSRGEELDGFCPAEQLESYASEEVVSWLVDVELFTREEQDGVHGFRVLKFEEWNETKAEIDKRLRDGRRRQKNSRAKKDVTRDMRVTDTTVTRDQHPEKGCDLLERRGTGTGIGSDLSEGESERGPGVVRKPADGEHPRVLQAFEAEFEKARGCKPVIQGAKDGAAAKKLLKGRTADEAIAIVRRAFADPFVAEKKPDLTYIASNVNAYLGHAPVARLPLRNGQVPLQPAGGGWKVGDGT